ncbi:hypothetical protein NIES4072_12900 [Nostoc commune NIES-4072]|uniref:NB-ARC domain-containing protein n=1 Tax=Nostoc commune NIES-4072 TaxID=2005467 RepID=A0A2R5FI68_NOSCO|nr:tetratricopeptide repeat protein [Nostoc commune]BBD65046.1 hypothetical protein NIES4070_13920 [Nostoc commune HK-02]GBG17629.1 hypothetical protein NIES4072_12900 [Nostoc commune NIES-4072]
MPNQSEGWNLPKSWNRRILQDWEIDRLLTNLEVTLQKRYRQSTRKDLLLGLLCGYSLKKIGQDLHKENGVVRAGLTNIYRDIEALTGEANKSVKSSNLAYVLEKHGYRRGSVVSAIQRRDIPHNLPAPTYTQFIGREADMKKLLERLSSVHGAHMITVHGIGGVGKTALVLAAAYLCLKASNENSSEAPKFDAIIFTSAKQQELIPTNSILWRQQGQRNLRDIFREIANALNDPTILQSPPNDQFDRVRQILSKRRTLLIVDNMETIEDRDEVIEFLYNLPICIKVIITSREQIALLPIRLRNLPPDDGLQLIRQQAEEKGISINDEDSKQLYDRTGGIPLAIVYSIGQLSSGYSLNLRAVLYWCKDQDRYEAVRDLWMLLIHYANVYAYWDDRLDWLQWLIEQSERRGEWSSFVKIIVRKSWLLIRECSSVSLKEADKILRRTWILRDHADLCVQADLAESMARLQIRQKDYQDARHWLTVEEKLVIEANLEERQHIRYFIPVLYHRAEILYLEGEYSLAKKLFQDVMQSAEKISWHRVINSARNWLADIAIEQGDRNEAEKLLIQGFTVAEMTHNKRRLARYQRSLARWEKKWGSAEKAYQLSIKAIDGFKLLGMTRDAQEMQIFLDSP